MNKASLIGNVGADAKVHTTPSGKNITEVRLATSAGKNDTDWHNLKAFGKTGELMADLTKGEKVYIEGRISYGSYEKDGQTRHTTDILVNYIEFLSSKKDKAPSGDDGGELPF